MSAGPWSRSWQRKQKELRDRYGVAWRITGVASRRLGWLTAPAGFSAEKLLAADFTDAQAAGDVQRVAASGWGRRTV